MKDIKEVENVNRFYKDYFKKSSKVTYIGDPTEDFYTEEPNELEEAIRDSRRHQKEKLKLLDKIDKANVQLQFMVDLFRGLEDKDHYANRMIEIINTLKS